MRGVILVVVASATILLGGCSRHGIPSVDLEIERTFNHPVLFQLREAGGNVTLRTIVRAGAGGYDHGPIASDQSHQLSGEEIATVKKSLQRVLASSPQRPPGILLDGSHWYLRVRSFTGVKLDVRSPDYKADTRDSAALFDFGLLLWRVSKIGEPEKDLY